MVYRKKFKNTKLELGETADQFAERLRRYLIQESLANAKVSVPQPRVYEGPWTVNQRKELKMYIQ